MAEHAEECVVHVAFFVIYLRNNAFGLPSLDWFISVNYAEEVIFDVRILFL